MRARIAFYRRIPILATENATVACILLAEPFFWPEELWISAPIDFNDGT
jgi:putative restriction endonuclease